MGRGIGNDAKGNAATKTFDVIIDGISPDDLIGAPVLNEGGFAVGVVLGKGAVLGGRQAVVCADLPFLVNGH
jgi:hypothetical protein